MTKTVNEAIKVSSFGRKNKVLLINKEIIQYKNKTIIRAEITGIKHHISAIQFYRFKIGEQFYLGLKTSTDQIDIILTRYFDISADYFTDLETQITEAIWERTTDHIWHLNKSLLLSDGIITIGNCQISKEGILIIKDNALAVPKQQQISWPELHYQILNDRVVLNNSSDYSIYTNLYFKDTWNIDILIALLEWITQENGLAEMQSW